MLGAGARTSLQGGTDPVGTSWTGVMKQGGRAQTTPLSPRAVSGAL